MPPRTAYGDHRLRLKKLLIASFNNNIEGGGKGKKKGEEDGASLSLHISPTLKGWCYSR